MTKEQNKAYYERNKEKIIARNLKSYYLHKAERHDYKIKYYREHRDELLEKQRVYAHSHYWEIVANNKIIGKFRTLKEVSDKMGYAITTCARHIKENRELEGCIIKKAFY